MLDLWEIREIPGRNGGRRVRRLRPTDDRAIKEMMMRYNGPRQGVFRLMVPRSCSIEVDNEEIDRNQKKIKISFNKQVAIARVALDGILK